VTRSSSPLATLDHYLRVAFGDLKNPDMALAADLAAENVHHVLQADLAEPGAVEVMTELETADKACAYRVSGPNDSRVDVEVSTVLPYAAVLSPDVPGRAHYLTEPTGDWTDRVLAVVRRHGLFPLSGETCRAASPVVWPVSGERMTYFEVLFRDELGVP
jgi:hypothetical protein